MCYIVDIIFMTVFIAFNVACENDIYYQKYTLLKSVSYEVFVRNLNKTQSSELKFLGTQRYCHI